jgi:hypothetical protein
VANEEHDFAQLLRDAPMASDADTVTVVGILARTHDAAHFMLTLPDGRSVTLEVNTVKSAKAIAGAIGQSVVQLELDAKRVPESVRDFRIGPVHKILWSDHKSPASELNTLIAEHPYGNQGHTAVENIGATGGPGAGIYPGGAAAGGPTWFAQPAPFVAAMPHQADPTTIEALALFGGTRTYFNAYVWASDHHTVLKPRLDQP